MQNTFSDKFEEFLLSFSLFTTVPLITTTKQGKGAIECLNGIRVLAFMAVIFGHTYALATFDSLPQVLGKLICFSFLLNCVIIEILHMWLAGRNFISENDWFAYSKWIEPAYMKLLTMDVYVDTFFILRY